jgi:uncharacterized protein
MLDGLIELMQAKFRSDDLAFAQELANVLLDQFEDKMDGGFFFTSHSHEKLIQRAKPSHDTATPSGNAVAALALQRLACLTGDMRHSAGAERVLKLFYQQAAQRQGGFSSLMGALAEHIEPPETVILRGPADALPSWKQALARLYAPHRIVLAIPAGAQDLTEILDKPVHDIVNAWVCHGVTCLTPIDDLQELLETCQSGLIN